MDLPEDQQGDGEDELEDGVGGRVIRVEDLVREFLNAQTLSVLEEGGLGMAVESFVDKDDKKALQDFVEDTLKEHVEVQTRLRPDGLPYFLRHLRPLSPRLIETDLIALESRQK